MKSEALLLVILAILLGTTAWLLGGSIDLDAAVWAARGVCVALTLLLLGGLIVPWRRHLARKRAAERQEAGQVGAEAARTEP